MTTVAQINKVLAKRGLQAEFFKGNGYFYLMGKDVDESKPGIYVNAINQLPFDSWMQEIEDRLITKEQ